MAKSDILDNDQNLTWLWEQVKSSDDWNSLPTKERITLMKRLQRAFGTITEGGQISIEQIQDLIILTSPTIVWDAMLKLNLQTIQHMNKYELYFYFRAVVVGTWKDSHPTQQPILQKPIKKRDFIPASWVTAMKYDSRNVKVKRCVVCGGKLRSDNTTGYCRECQRNGQCSGY